MKLLIVRLGALGDIVHAVPVAVALRDAYPDAQIDWLVSAKHRAVLDLVSVLDRHIVVDDRGHGTGGLPMTAAIGELRRTGYDVAIDLQGLMKSALLARLSGASRVIGFTSRYARESLASLFYTERSRSGRPRPVRAGETRHVVQINLGILSQLGIEVAAPEFRLRAPQSVTVADAIARAGRLVRAAEPRRRVAEQALAAGALWCARPGAAGTPRARIDRPVGAWRAHARRGCRERVGRLRDIGAADGHCRCRRARGGAAVMVSGDTGPTHIASAVGTPFVGIYGPTRPERNGPLATRTRWCRARRSASVITCGSAGAAACACWTSRSTRCSTP